MVDAWKPKRIKGRVYYGPWYLLNTDFNIATRTKRVGRVLAQPYPTMKMGL